MLIIGRGFFVVDEWNLLMSVLVELFSKRFSDMFFCNGRMNTFDDNFFIVPVTTKRFLTITARKDAIFLTPRSVSFSESV